MRIMVLCTCAALLLVGAVHFHAYRRRIRQLEDDNAALTERLRQLQQGSLDGGRVVRVKRNTYDHTQTRYLSVAEFGADELDLYERMNVTYLQRLAKERHGEFAAAYPFPHVVLDDVWPAGFLRRVAAEFPELGSPSVASRQTSNACRNAGEISKCSISDDGNRLMETPYSRAMFNFLLSPIFVAFLEELTGVKQIISDNAFRGSGFDQTLPGGSLGIHTDFHFHKTLSITRRVNVFVYLNEDWKRDYGGNLELWSALPESCTTLRPKPKRREKSVPPLFNRMFVFATGDRSFHGHPMPLNTSRRTRRSIAMYYYTNGYGKLTTERHGGALYEREPFMPESMVCSGVPAHHKTTVFPACAEFALGSTKEGLRCPKDRLGDP